MFSGIVQQFQPAAQSTPTPARAPMSTIKCRPRLQGVLAPHQLTFCLSVAYDSDTVYIIIYAGLIPISTTAFHKAIPSVWI